jgi:hypothetical protein
VGLLDAWAPSPRQVYTASTCRKSSPTIRFVEGHPSACGPSATPVARDARSMRSASGLSSLTPSVRTQLGGSASTRTPRGARLWNGGEPVSRRKPRRTGALRAWPRRDAGAC